MKEKVYDFPDRKQLGEEAAEWLIRLDGDTPLSEDDASRLHEWLARSPVHREELKNLLSFYNKMNVLTELSVPLKKVPTVQAQVPSSKDRLMPFSQLAWSWQLVAASFLVVIATTLFMTIPGTENNDLQQDFEIYATQIGEQSSITLTDGSTIQLNTNSQVEVQYLSDGRHIKLVQGEAYFNVARDINRPFSVYASQGRVEAIGTAFAVRLREDHVNIAVTEGRIRLASFKQPINEKFASRQNTDSDQNSDESSIGILDAGQSTTLRAVDKRDSGFPEMEMDYVQNMNESELTKQLSWRDGLLIFTGDPLEDVIKEVSRYSPIVIDIIEPELRTIQIGGQFRVGDIEAMLQSLEANFQLRVVRLEAEHFQIVSIE